MHKFINHQFVITNHYLFMFFFQFCPLGKMEWFLIFIQHIFFYLRRLHLCASILSVILFDTIVFVYIKLTLCVYKPVCFLCINLVPRTLHYKWILCFAGWVYILCTRTAPNKTFKQMNYSVNKDQYFNAFPEKANCIIIIIE